MRVFPVKRDFRKKNHKLNYCTRVLHRSYTENDSKLTKEFRVPKQKCLRHLTDGIITIEKSRFRVVQA